MPGHKDQLIRKYYRKFLVSNISYIELIFHIESLLLLTFWVRFPALKYNRQLSHIRFQLNFWQNITDELFNVKKLIKVSQYFESFAEECFAA